MDSTMRFSAVPLCLPSLHIMHARKIHGTDHNQSCAMRSVLFWGQQVEWTSTSTPKGSFIKMYVLKSLLSLFSLIHIFRLFNVFWAVGELSLAQSCWLLSQITSFKIKSLSLLHRNRSWCGLNSSSQTTTSCIQMLMGTTKAYIVISWYLISILLVKCMKEMVRHFP